MEKLAVSKPPVEVHNRPGKSGRPVGGQESDQALQIDFCPHNAVFMVPALPAGLGER